MTRFIVIFFEAKTGEAPTPRGQEEVSSLKEAKALCLRWVDPCSEDHRPPDPFDDPEFRLFADEYPCVAFSSAKFLAHKNWKPAPEGTFTAAWVEAR